ncbi:hypothetical protein [Roseibacillus ishigakijimensis]|uniref:hypothetical protein n=1 Tax=Roseibacillus ishigakijimensis TaxID=454146 RepID=UPI0019052136|nr:hypothetical protein [Roseibacillus ishigakijimensis]
MTAATGRTLPELSRQELTEYALPGGDRQGKLAGEGEVRSPAIQHESVAYFERRGLLAGREVVTVVRNPFERALSQLFYLLRLLPEARTLFTGPSWADDLKRLAAFDGLLGHDLGACQVDWLKDGAGEVRVDRVLRFESLEEDFASLCADWGIRAELPHEMDSGRKFPWWQYYDEEARRMMAEKYGRDFEEFGYESGMPATGADEGLEERHHDLGKDRGFRESGRLMVPDGSLESLSAEGVWERFRPLQTILLAKDCRRALKPGGVLEVVTPDLAALGGLEDDPEFVHGYLVRHVPDAHCEAAGYVVNDLIADCRFVYDEGLLVETLAEGGFTAFERIEKPGWLVVRAC